MPELPEVETVRRGLEQQVLGRTVAAVTVAGHRGVRRQPGGAPELRGRLVGRTLVGARRRGKYLWLVLDDGDALVAHLGMSGQFRVGPVASPHDRVGLEFADGGVLRFVDQRTFGWLLVDEVGADGIPAAVAHVARDPFDPDYDSSAVLRRLRGRRSGVKRALLDQTLVSGIGNIYADEALWRARVHFGEPTDRISARRGAALLSAAAEVMAEALSAGGTSFDALYVDVNGDSGWFDRELAAYGRQGRPCPRCGTAIRRVQFANRSSFYCPRCQRPRPAARS